MIRHWLVGTAIAAAAPLMGVLVVEAAFLESAPDAEQYETPGPPESLTICHVTRTVAIKMTLPEHAALAHLNRHAQDYAGPCSP